MIKPNDLKNIIADIDNDIRTYAGNFSSIGIGFNTKFQNNMFITNERTIAAFANLKIKEKLSSFPSVSLDLAVNEFPIEILKKPTAAQTTSILSETDLPISKMKKWHKCYVDGCFIGNNIFYPKTNYLFVEYKMNNTFVFSDLATDYLKYKLYTFNDRSNTIFCYVICEKKCNYPSILTSGMPDYFLLTNTITPQSVTRKNVYIYTPSYEDKTIRNNDLLIGNSNRDILEIYEFYSDISDNCDEIYQIGEEQFKKDSERDSLILSISKDYNKKIICSSLIQKNYPYIANVYEKLKALYKNEFEEFSQIENFDEQRLRNFFSDGGEYRSFFDNNFSIDKKYEAMNDGLRASSYSSLNLLVLIDYFCEKKNISTEEKVILPNTTIGKGNNKKDIDYEEVRNNIKKRLNEYYEKSLNTTDKLFFMARKNIYFIRTIYPLLFEIDEDSNKIIGWLNNRRIHDLLDEIQVKINKIIAKTNYHEKIIVDDINDDLSKKLMELFGHIVSKY